MSCLVIEVTRKLPERATRTKRAKAIRPSSCSKGPEKWKEKMRFRDEKIDEEYERDCEIRIRKLKKDFNEWGSEARKKEQAYNEE
ncbi:hypothetical protein Tco_0937497 [Tanacetum coccineum]|uniref:Uncharacterized protein n=1 Tax=Tanacetum coccineum TaxID=301880 RepID=A0ABQ5DF81_9ASTR